jgi:hypothetical protein
MIDHKNIRIFYKYLREQAVLNIATATPEICNDGLHNDLDGKVDTQDEECMVGHK